MGDDAAAVIAEVAPGGAHLVGVSLGSFIAQAAAIGHPTLVRSLTSIMGRPGDGKTGKVSKRMTLEFLRPQAADQADALVASFKRIGSTGRTADDEADVRSIVRRSAQRSTDDSGSGRQMAAILTEKDRTEGLRTLRTPALVIHGDRDRVVLPSGGRSTAAALENAELLVLPGMGHDLARRLWPEVIDAITRTVARGETARS
jgi:pimeloyl-ACP methyl ester carboxylesterase